MLILIAPLLSVSDQVTASIWQDLWQNPDQQGLDALDAGDAATAQSLFEDSQWRGSAAYRAGDYENAIGEFTVGTTPHPHFTRGNPLARPGALEAHSTAIDQPI